MIRQSFIKDVIAAETACIEQDLNFQTLVEEPGKKTEAINRTPIMGFSLRGSAQIRIDDGTRQIIEAGTSFTIPEFVYHETVAGRNGWEWVMGWPAVESEQQAA